MRSRKVLRTGLYCNYMEIVIATNFIDVVIFVNEILFIKQSYSFDAIALVLQALQLFTQLNFPGE